MKINAQNPVSEADMKIDYNVSPSGAAFPELKSVIIRKDEDHNPVLTKSKISRSEEKIKFRYFIREREMTRGEARDFITKRESTFW